mgnify:CR=1 FL=1
MYQHELSGRCVLHWQWLPASSMLITASFALHCTVQVLRDGQRQTIPSEELVPGDIVLIKSGDKVPADLRLITSNNLQVCLWAGRLGSCCCC